MKAENQLRVENERYLRANFRLIPTLKALVVLISLPRFCLSARENEWICAILNGVLRRYADEIAKGCQYVTFGMCDREKPLLKTDS